MAHGVGVCRGLGSFDGNSGANGVTGSRDFGGTETGGMVVASSDDVGEKVSMSRENVRTISARARLRVKLA